MDAMMVNRAVRRAAGAGLAAALLALAGCGSIGNPLKAIGGSIEAPDEFQVIARKPLQMPASAELPEPRPGAPSPLDPDPHRDAIAALLGASAAPTAAAGPSAGEQVLLSSANAAAASSDIRVQLEQDKVAAEAKKPYQPPSLGALLGGGEKEKVDEAEMLDPVAESQRLQQEGYRTPSDPEAVAATPESQRPEPVEPTYPVGRPQSPIKVPGTGPAN
jgi:hypothetical protein